MSIAALFLVIPVSFVVSNAPFVVRLCASLIMSGALLLYTLRLGLPLRDPLTMMCSVMPCTLSLLTIRMLMVPEKSKEDSRKSSGFLWRFVQWSGQFLWFVFPVVKSMRPKTAGVLSVVLAVLDSLLWAAVKFALHPLLLELMTTIATGSQRNDTVLALLFTIWVGTGTWTFDALRMLVILLTWGRYEVIPFNNYPLLSSSISDFWSHRYNLHIRSLLHYTVFLPAQSVGRMPPAVAALASFAASGLLHAYVAHVTFGHGEVSAFLFFVLHGLMVAVDQMFLKYQVSPMVRAAFTPLIFIFTYSLYIGLFLQAMPEWLYRSADNIQPNALSDAIAPAFHHWLASPLLKYL